MSEIGDKYTKSFYYGHYIERNEDFILPDSFPDVKNLISCNARISDEKSYFGPIESEVTVCVIYNILFSCLDNEGKATLSSVSFKEDIKESIKYNHENNIGVFVQSELTQANCRMANPRKFAIKTLLKTNVFEEIEENVYPIVECELPNNANLQYLTEETETLKARLVNISDHSFSDNVELDTKYPEIKELVHWDGKLFVREDKRGDSSDSALNLKAVFSLFVLYIDSEGKYSSINKDIPFAITLNDDERAMLHEIGEYTFVSPYAYISAMNLNVGKNQYGESKVLEFDADYDISLLMACNKKISVVSDAYSTEYLCDISQTKDTFLCMDSSCNTNVTCSDVIECSSRSGVSACIGAQSTLDEINVETDDKITCKMKIKTALVCDDGSISARDIIIPVSCKCNLSSPSTLLGNAAALGTKLRYDGEKIYSDGEVYFNLSSLNNKTNTVCKSIKSIKTEVQKQKSVFSIYFQSPDESLWNTAKSKKTTIETINKLNPDYDSRYGGALIIE